MARKSISENWFVGGFKIFFNSIKLYFVNFEIFLKLLAFPVLGQLLGLCLIFLVNYLFIKNIAQWAKDIPLFNNITFVFTLLILLLIPGFLIFAKAFFDYILSMASLNLMANNILSTTRLKDVEIHKDMMKSRILGYVMLILILSIMFFILSFPLLWVLLLPIMILWSLSIQAYILEDDLSPFGAINRSYLFVRYNFFKTTFVLLLLFGLCYFFLPNFFNWAVDKMNLPILMATPIDLYVNLLPINDMNALFAQIPFDWVKLSLEAHQISMMLIQTIVASVVIGFTLPIRAIACTSLYVEFRNNNITHDDTEVKKIVKRATGK